MATTATDTKTRAARQPLTEFGRKLKGFVGSVDPHKLNIRVAALMGETETDKVGNSISGMVRRAGQENGVLSIRSKELVDAVLSAVVELDSDQATIAEKLLHNFHFQPISSANREPGQNWLVRLKGGEEVALKDGPNGPGTYKLEFVSAELAEDTE